jgi:hypothetical protein
VATPTRTRPRARSFRLSRRFDGCASIDGWDAPGRTGLASPPSCSPQAPGRASAAASSLPRSKDARSCSTSSNASRRPTSTRSSWSSGPTPMPSRARSTPALRGLS